GLLYSLSDATRSTLAEAREPLVIRGYFSAQTHPLLAPLVPQLRDLLKEYAIAGGHNVQVEFINPQEDKAKEEEAAGKYGVQPVPFQIASKYQAGVVSTYFNVVVAYGDQFETMGFRDLIEIKGHGNGQIDVALRDPEYAITRAIRKVISGYRSGGSPFSNISGDVRFKGYISPSDKLPTVLQGLRGNLDAVLADLGKESGGRFKADIVDPDANGGQLGRELTQRFGYRPQIASLDDPRPFWFYMALEGKGGTQAIPWPTDPTRDGLRRSITAALQRMGSGALKTVALVAPPGDSAEQSGYTHLRQALSDNARVMDTDLSSGQVPADADLLMVLAPHDLNDKQVFAIDQFLMQGGSVVMATSPFSVAVSDTITAMDQRTGLEDWLKHLGISIDKKLVMDPRSAALPMPSVRDIGGIQIRDVQMLPYPPFPDLRGTELNQSNPITANLNQLTFSWSSPLIVDSSKQAGRKVDTLAQSSSDSWLGDKGDATPDIQQMRNSFAASGGKHGSSTLAVAMEGRFESYYKGKQSPLAKKDEKPAATDASAPAAAPEKPQDSGVIDRSPDTARLVLISANNFASDMTIDVISTTLNTLYTAPTSFMQNAVDWSLEDRSLLALRGRSHFARTLEPLDRDRQQFWEMLNYGLAIAGLVIVWLVRRGLRIARNKRYSHILKEVSA
ncbi:MAG TPA: Gldg family protein, partial [Rhodocyclaceae bacterium]|nr:Gldg family protein [Rhodocyclaceae bacterium]